MPHTQGVVGSELSIRMWVRLAGAQATLSCLGPEPRGSDVTVGGINHKHKQYWMSTRIS